MPVSPEILSRALKAFAVAVIANGAQNAILGVKTADTTANMPTAAPHTALFDSQLRYLGCLACGFGSILWWTSNDLENRREILKFLAIAMFAGGLNRLRSALVHGFSNTNVKVMTLGEVSGPIMLYLLGW